MYVNNNLSNNLGGSLNIRASGGDGNIVTFASKDSKLAQYIDITSAGVKLNCKVNGEWGNTINLATKDDLTPVKYTGITAAAGKTIVENASYKIGKFLIINLKVRIDNTNKEIFNISDRIMSNPVTTMIGIGEEWSSTSSIYMYVGEGTAICNVSALVSGKYLHICVPVILK